MNEEQAGRGENSDSQRERSRPRPRTAKALPTDRLKFEMQVRALKSLALESQNGSRSVGAAELARRMGVAQSTAGLNNAFFTDAGLATQAGKGRFKPTEAAIAFEREAGFEDDAVAARKRLAGPLSECWFFEEIKSQVALNDASEVRVMTVLANAAGAGGAHRPKLRALLDWLELAGLIVREGGEITLAEKQTGGKVPGTPSEQNGDSPRQNGNPPEGEEPTTQTTVQEDRGPVVLEVKFSCSYTAKDLAELEPEQIKALYEAVGGVQAVQAVLLKGRENT
jgi:hypothetical protein